MNQYSGSSVGLNPMVRRQTARSKFSHFEPVAGDTFDEMQKLIADCLAKDNAQVTVVRKEDGLIISLRLPEEVLDGRGQFFCSIVKLKTGMQMRTVVAVRPGGLPDEQPYPQSVVVGEKKTPSRWVDVILYHRDALGIEERTWKRPGLPDVVVDADWQVVSVNVHIRPEGEPPTPMAMARNHAKRLGRPEGVGGTARTYTDDEYMEAELFWGTHAMVAGEDE